MTGVFFIGYTVKQFFISVFIAAAVLCLIPAVIFSAEDMYTLSGTVTQSGEGPAETAYIALFSTDFADTTDTNGRFKIGDIPAGTYLLTVSNAVPGWKYYQTRLTVPDDSTSNLLITLHPLTYRVDEVVVRSLSGDDSGTEELPSHVTVVSRSDFERNSSTVADVIAQTPGAYISSTGGLGDYTEISLRGSYSNQVNVFLDGMLLNEALGGTVDLSTIPLGQVEQIEIWRSGAPAEFGGDSAGGVVNIKTRGMSSGINTVSLGYGSFNTFTAGSVLNVPLGMSKIQLTVDHSASDNDFEYSSDNGTMYNSEDDYTARRNNDEYRSTNLLSKYSRVFENGMLLELSDHILTGNKNIPGKDNKRYSNASLSTRKNLFQAKLTFNPLFEDQLSFEPRFHHIYNREHYRDTSGTVGWGFQDNIYNTNTFNVVAPLSLMLGSSVRFTTSVQAKHESFSPDFKLENFAPLASSREQLGMMIDAVYTASGKRLTVTANARRERLFSSFEGQPSSFNRTTPEAAFHHHTNAQTGVKYTVARSLSLKANYGDITRVPSLYELFGDRGTTLSNAELKPERTRRWDAGIATRFGSGQQPVSGTVAAAYFENRYTDLIQWYTDDGGFVTPDNVGGSYVKGIETVWSSRLFGRVLFSGNWSLQTSKVTTENRIFFRGKCLPNRPRHYGNLKAEYSAGNISVFWMLNAKSAYYLDRTNQSHKRYPGRTLNDIGLTVRLKECALVVTALTKNIADVRTFDIQGLPKPGRSFMLICTYMLK